MERYAAPRGHGELTPEDLRYAVTGERRRELRFPCSGKRIGVLRCDGDGSFRTANLVDCSAGGIGLSTEMPMRRGERFLVKLRLGRAVRLVVYTVRHCAPAGPRRYAVGARFAEVVGPDGDRAGGLVEAIMRGDATTTTTTAPRPH